MSAFLICSLVLQAHGSLTEQIATVTVLIDRFPDTADLYFKRAELYRVNRDSDLALSDYRRAAALKPDFPAVDLGRGLTCLQAGRFVEAKASLDKFLAGAPSHATALVARARTRVRLGDNAGAAADFARAIASAQTALPEFYVERADAFAGAGEDYLPDALAALDDGVERLGPLVTLELAAIDIDLRLARYDDALARIDKLAAHTPGRELWLTRRGEILLTAGRVSESQDAFRQALSVIETLPPHRRLVPATVEREQRLRAALDGNIQETK